VKSTDDSKVALAARNIEFGIILRRDRRVAAAEKCFRTALDLCPDSLEARYHLAHLLERTNRPAEADDLVTKRPGWAGDARLDLVAARVERRLGRPLAAIRRLETADCSRLKLTEQGAFEYELGYLHDQLDDTAAAFSHFEAANRLMARDAKERGYDKHRFFSTLYPVGDPRLWSLQWVRSWQPPSAHSDHSPAPIFVFGFPRSGTTLIGQILGSHPCLQTMIGTGAAMAMRQHVDSTLGGYPGALPALTPEQAECLRRVYADHVQAEVTRRPDSILVDKFPYNLMLVPLILRVFPHARFVMILRHPYDACLSAFMQNFEPSLATVHYMTLEDTAQAYVRTMTFWNDIAGVYDMDSRTHTIRYEDFVRDFEPQARALFQSVDVPWDPTVLQYDRHALKQGEIETPSYHQVVKPIYRDSIGRWQRYAAQMAPITETLRPFVERFGY
jgi:hypothetical protein